MLERPWRLDEKKRVRAAVVGECFIVYTRVNNVRSACMICADERTRARAGKLLQLCKRRIIEG